MVGRSAITIQGNHVHTVSIHLPVTWLNANQPSKWNKDKLQHDSSTISASTTNKKCPRCIDWHAELTDILNRWLIGHPYSCAAHESCSHATTSIAHVYKGCMLDPGYEYCMNKTQNKLKTYAKDERWSLAYKTMSHMRATS